MTTIDYISQSLVLSRIVNTLSDEVSIQLDKLYGINSVNLEISNRILPYLSKDPQYENISETVFSMHINCSFDVLRHAKESVEHEKNNFIFDCLSYDTITYKIGTCDRIVGTYRLSNLPSELNVFGEIYDSKIYMDMSNSIDRLKILRDDIALILIKKWKVYLENETVKLGILEESITNTLTKHYKIEDKFPAMFKLKSDSIYTHVLREMKPLELHDHIIDSIYEDVITIELLEKIFETPHPYPDDMDKDFEFYEPGTECVYIKFDSQCKTEFDYDYLEIFLEPNHINQWPDSRTRYTGGDDESTWPTEPLKVPHNRLYFHFYSDSSENDWGVKWTVMWYEITINK